MPAYKDRNNGTWFCKFSYKDFNAVSKQKWKRGFSTKKEALAYERNFLEQLSAGPGILFFNLYILDSRHTHDEVGTSTPRDSYICICLLRISPILKECPASSKHSITSN